MEVISIKLPPELRSRLATEAKRRNVAQSVIVREALEQALERSRGKAVLTCADVAGDLAGAFNSGRRDLATNKALRAEAVVADYNKRGRKRRR